VVTGSKTVVPFVNLPATHQALESEILSAITPLIRNAEFIMGKPVGEFEQDFAKYVGGKYCVSLNSGTAALHLALMALGIGPGDEVITAANTFIATVEAVSFVGATPVFVDCDPATYNIDVSKIEKAITKKTKAIIPVHLYGLPADMEPLLAIAKAHGLKVVEDACQGHGARYHGKRVGTFSDISAFSFYPGKNLGAAGDGGAIVTNDEALARHVRLIREHGSEKKYVHEIIGHNFRLDTLQAAVLKVKLPYLDKWNEQRRAAAAYYTKNLLELGLKVPFEPANTEHVYHLYVIQVRDRERVQAVLAEHGVQSGIHYPNPIHLQKAYAHLGIKEGTFPVSENAAPHILSLPMFPEITREQQDTVLNALKKAGDALK
jgi:dTDP-4-amino-4,6-dideoxygalactose transaminase